MIMGGKRKFRLSQPKNYERKKYFKPVTAVSTQVSSLRPLVISDPMIVSIPISLYSKATGLTSEQLLGRIQALKVLPNGWCLEDDCSQGLGDDCSQGSSQVFSVVKSCYSGITRISVSSDCHWTISINGNNIPLPVHTMLWFSNEIVSGIDMFLQLLSNADHRSPDQKFFKLRDNRKGKFLDRSGRTVAYYDNKSIPSPTIRTSNCSMFVCATDQTNCRCEPCERFRKSLFALLAKSKQSVTPTVCTSSRVNYRYLSTPEKVQRLREMRKENRALEEKVRRLRKKLDLKLETTNISLDDETSGDFEKVMEEEDHTISSRFEKDSFQYVFWKHQMESISKKGKQRNGNRWHPLMIRWCLFLRYYSGKAYDALRDSGCVTLPSQRTLRDYSNAVEAGAGFSTEVDKQILQGAKLATSPNYHSFVMLLLDEMHIREDLVYNKHSGSLVGFVDLGNVNNHLAKFEEAVLRESEDYDNVQQPRSLAKSMMVIMVRGIFTSFKFPYVQFPCNSLVGEQLFSLFWTSVFRLERMGFKVLGTTFDGASVNRRLVAIHDTASKMVYKLQNIHAVGEDRYIYCFSDPLHLIKTVRNCWSSKNRFLWNNGKDIKWQHLVDLYQRDGGKGSGLCLVPKLKFEHVHLTSFSKMRVDLAAQVLSESVGKAMQLTGGPETSETVKFILMFDKFFDTLNVSNFKSWKHHRKPFQKPYDDAKDERLKWLEDIFIPYLNTWEKSVSARQGCDPSQQKRMLLSTETLLGIRRTVKSFVEFVQYIFTRPEIKDNKISLLSNHICQDPLENIFGCQRQRGRTSDNPSVSEFFSNTQALRVMDSFCRGPVRGNCRGGKMEGSKPVDSTPLIKRRKISARKL